IRYVQSLLCKDFPHNIDDSQMHGRCPTSQATHAGFIIKQLDENRNSARWTTLQSKPHWLFPVALQPNQ
ncbi:MAG: hypothetical protein ABI365_04295, partial [Lysobacteraceae bacterium]